MGSSSGEIEPFLMAVLSSRIDSIAKQMSYVLQRSARSSVMSSARDFSTAICDATGDVLSLPNAYPAHCANASLTPKALMELHGDDMREGDAFLHNSPYHGNTHPADHTIIVPVYWEGELMFYCMARGHQADIGNSVPTTYHIYARDVYEEGALIFNGVRVQENYRDVDDIIRMCKMRIRVPDQWYGDYLAMIGGARIGERQLKEVMAKYGKDVVKTFCREYQEYGRRRMIEEIKKLPSGIWTNKSTHDPVPGPLPDGVTVKVKMTVDPQEGFIYLDFTDNIDSQPCGLNLCEATLTAGARTGVLNRLPSVPVCEGSMSRIVVKMREGSMIGKARHPFSSSAATTNVSDHVIMSVQCLFAQIDQKMAMAEGSTFGQPSVSIVSGFDSRYQRPFVTHLLTSNTGGAAVYGHDGYVNYMASNGGMMEWNPLENLELKYPVVFLEQEVIADSAGAGRWDGSPACRATIATLDDPVTFVYYMDGKLNPPKGIAGGLNGRPSRAAMRQLDDPEAPETELPSFHRVEVRPGEAMLSECAGGGGCGDPLERDPELVRHRAREGWISLEKAREVYGVALDTEPELYAVDYAATEGLRAEIRRRRKGR